MSLLDLLNCIIGYAVAPTSSLDELLESIQKDYKENGDEKSNENHDNKNTQDEQTEGE